MKSKLLTIFITAVIAITFIPFTIFADTPDMMFEYNISVDGKDTKKVENGDIITVVVKLNRTDSDENYTMYAMQNEICYDADFFKLVEGSEVIASGLVAKDIANIDNNRELFINYLSYSNNEIWNAETILGSFQLEVIAENGISKITSNDSLVSYKDGSGGYDCTSNNITVKLSDDCSVIFESNNETEKFLQKVLIGKKVEKPKDPIKYGYTFDGWYKDIFLTEKWDFKNDTVETNMYLYAKWTKETSNIPDSDISSFNINWLWLILILVIIIVVYKYYRNKKKS